MRERPAAPAAAVLALAALVAAVACKGRGAGTATVKVANGVPTDGFPAVVQIANAKTGAKCTATFLGPSTLLTAAHCLDSSRTGGAVYAGEGVVRVLHHGLTGGSVAVSPLDLALLWTAAPVAPAVAALARTPLAPGDAVTLVGYGRLAVDDAATSGVKRTGGNAVESLRGDGMALLLGTPRPAAELAPGADAASAAGDSGGPLLRAGLVAGTDSGGAVDLDGRKRSLYVDVSSPESRALLAKALAQGFELSYGE